MRIKPPLPTFLLVGAAKCGTTWFCELLGRHPQVFLHPRKELDFFSDDERYARGLDWYRRRFRGAEDAVAVGEGSPNYAKRARRPRAAERIARDLPEARILYIVRHPLRRIESAYLHALRAGHRVGDSFGETVRRFPEYVDTSHYERQIGCYRRLLPADRILVLFLEDLVDDPHRELEHVFSFLGVETTVRVDLAGADKNASSPAAAEGGASASRPVWDEGTLRFVRRRLAEPTRRFLRSCGKPEDFWSL